MVSQFHELEVKEKAYQKRKKEGRALNIPKYYLRPQESSDNSYQLFYKMADIDIFSFYIFYVS